MKMRQRTKKGSLAALAFIGLMPLLVAIGAFAVDFMHYNSTRAELQKACDAAALAGALEVWQYDKPTAGAGAANCEAAARAVAAMNPVDGRVVQDGADSDPWGHTTTVTVQFPQSTTITTWKNCLVSARMHIRGLFSKIIQNWTQQVDVSALAGPAGASDTAVGLFPLAIEIGQNDMNGKKLTDYVQDEEMMMNWSTNLYWTAFTSHNESDVRAMEEYWMDPSNGTQPPGVKLGQALDTTNGTQAKSIQMLPNFIGKVIALPIVDGGVLKGYMALLVTGAEATGNPKYIKGKLTRTVIRGQGEPPVYDASWKTWLTTNQNFSVRLLSLW